MTGYAVKSILFTSPILALMQATGTPDISWVTQIERVGLNGILILAVGVLWRSQLAERAVKDAQLAEKDKQILQALQQITTAMTSETETSRELRKIIEESVRTKQELKESFDLLAKGMASLPCALGEVEPVRVKR